MKLFIKTIILILFIYFNSYSAVSDIFSHFPTLNKQIEYSIDDTINKTTAKELLKKYYNSKDTEFKKGFEYILREEHYKKNIQDKNYALEILIKLLISNNYIENDTITIALAIANNAIYSMGDSETKKLIIDDCISHYNFYKKILLFQKNWNIKYNLSLVPVLNKTIWANRVHMFPVRGKLTKKDYLEYVDSINNLELIHKIVKDNSLYLAPTLYLIAKNLEKYVHLNLRFSLGEKAVYKNMSTTYDGIRWTNAQMEIFKRDGFWRGDCGVYTLMQTRFFTCAGIPSYRISWQSPGRGHHQQVYYNPFLQKWFSVQFLTTDADDVTFRWNSFKIHHTEEIFQGENHQDTTKEAFLNLFHRGGAGQNIMESIIRFSNKGQKVPDFINSVTGAPVLDTDNDGIIDSDEIKLGLNPKNVDTDNDGYSDLWEIENDYNPRDKNSPGEKILYPVIDGYTGHEKNLPGISITEVKKPGEEKEFEIYRVKSILGLANENNLYIGLTFFDDIEKYQLHRYWFRIQSVTNPSKQFWIRWRGYYVWGQITQIGEKEVYDIFRVTAKDTEFIIPMKYINFHLDNPKQVYVQAYIQGNRQTKSPVVRILIKESQLKKLNAKIVQVNSTDSEHPVEYIMDNNPYTFWHTKWRTNVDPLPHSLVIDLGKELDIRGLTYLPRQDMANGRIGEYEILIGTTKDTCNTIINKGRFPNTTDEQKIIFAKPVKTRFIKLLIKSEVQGNSFASIAEIDVIVK